jgi:glycosyltransferase involved in cell wall biosynthesis
MKRVLFVEASSGGVVGGSLTGLYHLIRGLDRSRIQAAMALYEHKAIEDDLRALGVTISHVKRRRLRKEHALLRYDGYRRAKQVRTVSSSLRAGRQTARLFVEEIPAALRLARLIASRRPDVAHLGNGLRANFDAVLACLLTRTPIVCHVKGFEKYGARERWASGRVAMLVCMTKALLEHCTTSGLHPPHSQVVYDGVDEAWLQPTRHRATVRRELGLSGDEMCIGVVGNVQEWKGQGVLIDAMARIADRYPAVNCLIVGGTHRAGASYAESLRQRVEALGLSRRVHFLGFRSDVVDVMNALDVIVHTSIRPEPFGRVILEGMLLGKPVVASAAGGVLELIEHGETGFLVPPGDAQALADCLVDVLSRPERSKQLGCRAKASARTRFSLSRQVEEMTAIYESAGEMVH